MKALDVIIKHKLWSVTKNTNFSDLDKYLENYLYDNAKIEIIDEIKTKDLLEKYLQKFILNQYNYKYEKKMFSYLKENIEKEKLKEIINQHSQQGLLLYWVRRNAKKTPHFEFLEYIDQDILQNGDFLSYAEKGNEKIIKYAIECTQSPHYKITEKSTQNLLFLKNIKGELKIQLFLKFKELVRENILEYVFENIKNEDEKTTRWLIKEFSEELNKQDKTANPLRCPYNEVMESILNENKNYDLFFEKNILFVDNFFHKVLEFKKQNKINDNPIDVTFKQFKKWNIEIKERELNSIFFELVNYETLDYFLNPENNFNLDKKIISVESLLYKMMKAKNEEKENLSNDNLKLYIEKIYQSGFHYIERGSNLFFLDNVNAENMDYLLKHPLFNYNFDKLIHSMWTRDRELGIQLANSIDKNIVWKYIDTLKKEDRVEFELLYYDEKFETKLKDKKIKI